MCKFIGQTSQFEFETFNPNINTFTEFYTWLVSLQSDMRQRNGSDREFCGICSCPKNFLVQWRVCSKSLWLVFPINYTNLQWNLYWRYTWQRLCCGACMKIRAPLKIVSWYSTDSINGIAFRDRPVSWSHWNRISEKHFVWVTEAKFRDHPIDWVLIVFIVALLKRSAHLKGVCLHQNKILAWRYTQFWLGVSMCSAEISWQLLYWMPQTVTLNLFEKKKEMEAKFIIQLGTKTWSCNFKFWDESMQ